MSKFHVIVITGSEMMIIFSYKGFENKSKIWKTGIWKSGDWAKLGIPNLAQIFLIKHYRMLQNASIKAFTFSELLRENQQEVISPHPRGLELKLYVYQTVSAA